MSVSIIRVRMTWVIVAPAAETVGYGLQVDYAARSKRSSTSPDVRQGLNHHRHVACLLREKRTLALVSRMSALACKPSRATSCRLRVRSGRQEYLKKKS